MQQAPITMVMRHCEKPTDTHKGILTNGTESEHSLIVRGWQRAGALVPFFAPSGGGVANPALARPAFLFATCPDAEGADSSDRSRREEETLSALSEKLAVELHLGFGKGKETEIAQAAAACNGSVLIAWDHNRIMDLAKAIAPAQSFPDK